MEVTEGAGYSSRLLSMAYAAAGPFYDMLVWWGFLPLGGEGACRREFVRWLDLRPGLRIASLCCGTGSMERAMLAAEPRLSITGVDLGRSQLACARRKNRGRDVTYVLSDATRTGLPSGNFDRVLIGLALHEMHRSTRLAVLREAHRLCRKDGRVLAIEHGRPLTRASRLFRALWWLFWIPGNPEVATSRDLQEHGLDNEMRECGLSILERHTTQPDWIEAFVATPTMRGRTGGLQAPATTEALGETVALRSGGRAGATALTQLVKHAGAFRRRTAWAMLTNVSVSTNLPAEMSVREGRDRYLAENGFSVAAYTAPTFELQMLGRTLRFKNWPSRQRSVPVHDIHHVLTGYGTDYIGEAEIGAWELIGGCTAFITWYLNGLAVLIGLLIAPLRVLRAMRSALGQRTLYWRPVAAYDQLLAMSIGDLREQLGIPRQGQADHPAGAACRVNVSGMP
jgi:ubiquinone/menaquinone biosynthesis C-methylase UbiE